MAADAVAKLRANTSDYDAGLAKAKKKLDEFVKSNTSLNGILAQGMNALTKFGAGFAAAQVAMKSFNAIVMEGSQTTGDFVRNGLGAFSDTLSALASDVATMDFSNLTDGLAGVYRQALAAREIMDSLGDSLRGLGLAESEAQAAIAELREVNSDAASTAAQQAAAVDKARAAVEDYKGVAETARAETERWIDLQVSNAGGFRTIRTDAEAVKSLTIAYAKMGSEAKAAYKKEAAEAYKELGRLKEQADLAENGARVWRSSYTGTGGGGHFETIPKGTAAEIKEAQGAVAAFEATRQDFLRSYVLFEKNSDEQMDKMAQNIQNISQYARAAATMERQMNKAASATPAAAKAAKPAATAGKAQAAPQTTLDVRAFDIPDPLAKSLPTMRELNAQAAYLKKQMEATADTAEFNRLEAAYAETRRSIEAQPVAIRAGISIDEAEIQAQIDGLGESVRMSIKADLDTSALDGGGKKARKAAADVDDSWKDAARAISSAGGAMQQLDSKGANIAGIIMEAVADVALAFASALAAPATTSAGIFGWIAAAAAGTATMIATIASIKSATSGSYASGGVVPGRWNGGVDSTYVYASPGEVILNRAQQENLLSQLDGVAAASGGGRSYVTGEQLITVINNTGRRRGRGELVFG